jgi:hypothetical protein
VRIRVSSNKLIPASAVFAAMLGRHGFREADELRQRGSVEIPLPDDDVSTMLRVLLVVQCGVAAAAASPTMSLPVLHQVAIIVDKYGMHGALRAAGQMWIDQPQPGLGLPLLAAGDPNSADFVSRVFVARVFGRAADEQRLLSAAAQYWWEPYDKNSARWRVHGDLPVPAQVFGLKAVSPFHAFVCLFRNRLSQQRLYFSADF